MPKATKASSTPRRSSKRPPRKTESAVAKVRMSGLELVPTRKSRGKLATLRDYQTIDFKPWSRTPGAGPTDFIPAVKQWDFYGTNCRISHAMCLKTRDELIAMHGKMEHETADAMMAGILETAEALKQIVQMCHAAYARILASAAAAQKAGIKFRFADRKPSRRKAVPAGAADGGKIKAGG